MKKFDYSWLLAILFFGGLLLFVTSCSSNSQELESMTFRFQGQDTVEVTLRKGDVADTIIFGQRYKLSIENNTPCIDFLTVDEPIKIISTEIYQNALYPQKITVISGDSSIEAWAILEGDNDLVKFIAADSVNSWGGIKYHDDWVQSSLIAEHKLEKPTTVNLNSGVSFYLTDMGNTFDHVSVDYVIRNKELVFATARDSSDINIVDAIIYNNALYRYHIKKLLSDAVLYDNILNFSHMEWPHHNWNKIKSYEDYLEEGGPISIEAKADLN